MGGVRNQTGFVGASSNSRRLWKGLIRFGKGSTRVWGLLCRTRGEGFRKAFGDGLFRDLCRGFHTQ